MKKKIFGLIVVSFALVLSFTASDGFVEANVSKKGNLGIESQYKEKRETFKLIDNPIKKIDRSKIKVTLKDENGKVLFITTEENFINNQDKLIEKYYDQQVGNKK